MTFGLRAVTKQEICYYRSGAVLVASAVKREEGANPSLSRNCKGVPTSQHATGVTREGAKKGRYPSQETCHADAVLGPPWNEGPEPECIQHPRFRAPSDQDRGFLISA